MSSIINFFLRNSVAANLLMFFILIMGMISLLQIKTTFFPEQESRIIQITTTFPGASPAEMEEGITSKIEENMIGIKGVERTTSVSRENSATISVEVEKGFDTEIVIQDVKNAVDQINSFPAFMEPPIIFIQNRLSEAFVFSISGDIDLRSLKNFAETIEDDLLAKEGISQIKIEGFPEEEIEISFRESDMRALNITFDEAVTAVAGNNLLSTGGTIKTEKEELLIRAENKNYYAKEFEDIVVRSNANGGVIKLRQIADIEDQWSDSPVRSYINDQAAVIMTVYNTIEEDMFQNVETAQTYLDEFIQKYPQVDIDVIRDGRKYLNGRINFIKENGLLGFLIVLGLLAMFLNIRIAFWVALAIPISFAGMFIAASMLGITINVISTFGMVVVIGILVDDGIVIAENIYQHYERGAPPMKAALNGTLEVLPAVTAAILTTVIAFASFFFVDGFLGDVFGELAIVVIFTLIFSLVEGAFILPAHVAHSKALKEGNTNKISIFFDKIMDFMKSKLYGPILKFSMKFSLPAVGLCVVMMMIGFGAFQGGFIKGTFFPNIESDDFGISLELPAGSREGQVEVLLDSIENAAWAVNERLSEKYYNGEVDVIEKISSSVGPNTYEGALTVYLLEGEERDSVRNRKIISDIRQELGPIDAAQKLVFGLGGFFGDPVSISLLSKNDTELTLAVAELKSELARIKDLRDIQDTNKEGLKELKIELKPKAYNLGFTLNDIIRKVRQGFFGAEIQRLQRGSDEVKVWVRYKLEDRSSISDLSNMRIRTNAGQAIPLSELINFKEERGVININHIEGQKEIRVSADVADAEVSVSDINTDIQNVILPKVLSNYPSVRVGLEGQVRETQETQSSIQVVMPIVLLCMFFVIVLTFGSVSQALMVFAILPFGFIGVAFGHWVTGTAISFLSMLGVIALIGILVNDALVFVSTFNVKIKEGYSFNQALYDTGLSRFRPITLTTVTTVAGLLPLLLESSIQAQFLIPMAISVAYGLMISTFILLVLLPALLSIGNRIRVFTSNLWTGDNHRPSMVEPSYNGQQIVRLPEKYWKQINEKSDLVLDTRSRVKQQQVFDAPILESPDFENNEYLPFGKNDLFVRKDKNFNGRNHPWVLTLFSAIVVLLSIVALVQFSLKFSEYFI